MRFKKLPIPFIYVLLAGCGLSILLGVHDGVSHYIYGKGRWQGWGSAFIIPVVNYVLWAFLVPFVYNILYLFPHKKLTVSHKLIHIGIAIGMALLHEVVSNLLYITWVYVSGFTIVDNFFLLKRLNTIPLAAPVRFLEYWIILGILLAIDINKKYRFQQTKLLQIEHALSEAQLNALKMQLQPHFLFNTLNTISSLMESSIPDAQKVVSRLGQLLRSMLEQDHKHLITLEKEMRYIRAYLDIEQIRFNDRLKVQYELEAEALRVLVPNLILQPLVENAIKHGFAKSTASGLIRVIGRVEKERLIMIVQDDGKGQQNPEEILKNPGIGLSNILNRLSQLYKDNYEFKLDSPPPGGFIAYISIPVG